MRGKNCCLDKRSKTLFTYEIYHNNYITTKHLRRMLNV